MVHQRIREISSKKYCKTTTGCIKDKNGNILFEEQTIKQRWTEYIKELYDNPEKGGKPIKFNNNLSRPEITKSEVREAISSMKNGKAMMKYRQKSSKLWVIQRWTCCMILQIPFTKRTRFRKYYRNRFS